MIHIREKVDEILFSDTTQIIFLCYGAVLFFIALGNLIAMGFGYPVWESPLQKVIVISALPFLIYILYYNIAPVIGDHE